MSPNFATSRICQFAICYFMFICLIGQRWLILASSEDIAAIPLSLYETKFLGDSGIRTSSDAKIGDSYKRSGGSAFYGLRGKKQSDSLETNGDEDDEEAFYPVRGKKKTTAFTALRGKKVFLGNEFSNEENNQQYENENNSTTLSQFLTSLKSNKDTWNSGRSRVDDGSGSLENVLHQRIYTPIKQENNPWINKEFPTEPLEGKNENANGVASGGNEQSLDKRRTSGFFPMRGRKSYSDVAAQFYANKRRSAFIPMRGRRSYEGNGWISDYSTELQKNAFNYGPSTKSRRSIWNQDGIDNVGRLWSSDSRWPFSQEKRAAFHAVRGKKQSQNWDYPKRAFHASRGKRVEEEEETENEGNDDTSMYLDDDQRPNTNNNVSMSRVKRSMQRKMARGKSRTSIAMKRPITFFATRGKRFEDNAVEPAPSFLLD